MGPGTHELFPSPPPRGPTTCKPTSTRHDDAITTTAVRVCVPPPSCADACDDPAFKTCLLAAGDLACPAPGLVKRLVGTKAEVAGPACGCTAVAPATCAGTWTLYSDSNCGNVQNTIPPDICSGTSTNTVGSYRWTPSAVAATCTPSPTPGVPALVGATTLCCK